jgi:polysaccharide deacetylase 2 family uncharacterized protein YibQ
MLQTVSSEEDLTLIDSGSAASILSNKLARKIGIKMKIYKKYHIP